MLLDTCALLWLAHDQRKISTATLEKISSTPVVCITSITGFEIGLKYSAGKLRLPMPPHDWLFGIVQHHQIDILDLTLDIAMKATQLPAIHRDPCDRFIIATAIVHGLPIVTADQRFAAYGVEVIG